MRLKLLITVALLVCTGALRADTITGTVTGVIGTQGQGPTFYTTDTQGLFGAAGANLYGNSFKLTYSYNTADFQNPATSCGTNCTDYTASSFSSADSISYTVNGKTQSFTPSTYSDLSFQNASASNPGYSFGEDVDPIYGGSSKGAGFVLNSANGVVFGQPVTPAGNTVNNLNTIFFYNSAGAEGLVFTPSTPSPAPEPSSIILVGTGLLGMAGVLKRRYARKLPSAIN